jgi:hypothetical protein
MSHEIEVKTAEGEFFEALLRGNREQLEDVLGPDFVLIDVMTGSEIPRAVLADLVGSGQLVFDSIERLEARVYRRRGRGDQGDPHGWSLRRRGLAPTVDIPVYVKARIAGVS